MWGKQRKIKSHQEQKERIGWRHLLCYELNPLIYM